MTSQQTLPSEPSPEKARRLDITLPPDLFHKLQQYAGQYRFNNKSGFIADALHFYIAYLDMEAKRHPQPGGSSTVRWYSKLPAPK